MNRKLKRIKRNSKKFLKKIALIKRNNNIIKYYNNLKIIEKSIFLESKNGKDLGGNIFYIMKELSKEQYKEYEIILSLRKDKYETIERLLSKYNINNFKFVDTGSKEYYKYLYSSKYLINDTSFPTSFIKKESQIYLNTWHGTPLKKLGKDVPNRAYALGNIQKNLISADYLLYPNHFMEKRMINAFMLENLTNAKIINAGYPRNSIFFDKENRSAIRNKLRLDDKQIIVYMPTWRGTLNRLDIKEHLNQLKDYFFEIDNSLNENQVFFVKLHLFVSSDIDFSEYNHIKAFPENYETYEILNMSDCLITDYSSVFFDFVSSNKKIIIFAYDEEEYNENHGLYIKLNELPFPKAQNVQDLMEQINSDKNYDDKKFVDTFCKYDGAEASKHICEYLLFKKNSDKINIKNINDSDKKENVLIYSGNLAKNGITSSLLSLLENIDLHERNYYLCFIASKTRKYSSTLFDISKKVDFISMKGRNDYTIIESLAFILYNKFNISNKFINKNLDIAYTRNLKKYFPTEKFDKVIHFTGYEKDITAMLQRFERDKYIFAHNDLLKEIKTKSNQHFLTLNEAYNNYNKVAIVSEDIKRSISKIKGNMNNIVVVENFVDYKTILKKSDKRLEFDELTVSNLDIGKLNNILDSNALKFITIGRFSHEKGHIRLMSVFNEFYKTNNNSYLIIIGGYGKLYKKTLEYSKQLESRENIIIIKYLSNPFPILKKCDLFILSSFYEGLGLVLLESDILGVKVFSTNVSGPKTFMKKYNGLLVENSEKGISKGIQCFIENKIPLLNINYQKYNKNAFKHFESLLED